MTIVIGTFCLIDLHLWYVMAGHDNVLTLEVHNRDQHDYAETTMSVDPSTVEAVLADLKVVCQKDHLVADKGSYLHRYTGTSYSIIYFRMVFHFIFYF